MISDVNITLNFIQKQKVNILFGSIRDQICHNLTNKMVNSQRAVMEEMSHYVQEYMKVEGNKI